MISFEIFKFSKKVNINKSNPITLFSKVAKHTIANKRILLIIPETANFILNLFLFDKLGNILINTIRITIIRMLIISIILNDNLENNLFYY